MKYIFLFISILLTTTYSYSQIELTKDPEAKKILDAVSKKIESYNSLRIKFDYLIENKQNNFKQTHKGYAFLQGEKYKIIIPTIEIFSDGNNVWTYSKESNEITITKVVNDEESIYNPAKLFNLYKNGYKYLLIGEEKIENIKYSVIDLFPENLSESLYSKIRIKIKKATNEIFVIETYGKSGLNNYLTIKENKPNIKVTEQMFNFDKTKYPDDIEIIDMRF